MKYFWTIIPLVVLSAYCGNSYSQPQSGELYGVCIYRSGNEFTGGFAGINPVAGTSQGITEIYSGMNFGGPDHPSIDPVNKRCFLEYNPQFYQPMHLVTVDMQSGSVVYDVEVQSLGDTAYWIDKVFFNPADQMIYTIYTNGVPEDSVQVVTINPATGVLTPVFKLSPTVSFAFNGFNPEEQIIYGFYEAGVPNKYLVSIDLLHHTESRIQITTGHTYPAGFTLAYNCVDGCLYGIINEDQRPAGFDFHIVRVNPSTGETDFLLSLPEASWFEDVAIDPLKNKLYAYEMELDGSAGKFCTYDIAGNAVLYAEYHGPALLIGFSFDIYSPREDPLAAFESSNFCLHGVTQFESSPNSNAAFYFWNFGDPASPDNSSTGSNPTHIFSHAGDYNVELIVTNCRGTDTFYRQITIEDFPVVNIGPDTSLCTNMISPVVLSYPDAGSYDAVWSTGERTPSIEVTTPGVYWMKLSASCGNVSDTVMIDGKICDCAISIQPDLTSRQLSVEIGCDLRNFSEPRVTLYNMLGQQVSSIRVNEVTSQYQFEGLSAGMYVVRLEDKGRAIISQKVVIAK